MSFETLENLSIKLIDGDRGKNYPKQSDFFDKSDCLFLSAKNVTKNGFEFTNCSFISMEKDHQLRAGKLERNDIVLTTRGTIGNLALYDESVSINDVRINSGMIILRPNTTMWNPRFLYFLLSSDLVAQQISALTSGSAVPQLPARDLKKFVLPVVPLINQNKIVEIIGAIVDKVQINRAINQTLEQMAQALFKSWFVDFEPVKAKMAVLAAGGSQEEATLAAMTAISGKNADALAVFKREHPEQYAELKATAELFPLAMQDSELGEIPEGWTLSEIGAQIDIAGGATPSTKTPDFWDNGDIHWTTPKDLSNVKDKILLHTERKITKAGLGKISSGLLPVNTVLMSSRAPVGYLAIAKVPVAINQGYIAMKCNKELSPEFVLQWCSANMPEIISRASGTTFAEISKKNFNPIPLVKPPLELVKNYTKQVSAIYSLIENTMRENNSLTELRDTLLPKLLSGEITLPEAEQAVSEVENV
ncbi:restriction endonuclease subunit S [Escherichia coli]|nr:restriction endonuclease subunit S [Escherichia coli]